jgi:hypothetical protein
MDFVVREHVKGRLVACRFDSMLACTMGRAVESLKVNSVDNGWSGRS